jgi:hypothetical protein
MITSGTDGLSRKRWAKGHRWSFRQAALEKLLDWARHSGQVHIITPMQIANGTAFGKLPAKVILAFPGQNHIERWIEHLVQQRVKACVILPDWHGPAMSAVEQAQVARLQLGPAYGVFNASGGKEIPGWMMVATLVDFSDDAEVDLAGATPPHHHYMPAHHPCLLTTGRQGDITTIIMLTHT